MYTALPYSLLMFYILYLTALLEKIHLFITEYSITEHQAVVKIEI